MQASLFARSVALMLVLSIAFCPLALAQREAPANFSFLLGTVYEVDKERYRDYVAALRRSNPNLDESALDLDAERFLDERDRAAVIARQLATNQELVSPMTGGSGEYTIRDAPPGTFEFTIRHDGLDYPVQQRLDVNVELSYVAELCFVLDHEEQMAWMVTDGPRRGDDVPPWVPRECRSALSACLALLTDSQGRLPDSLLLFLVGGGAALGLGLGLGLTSTDEIPSSPVTREPPQ